MPEAFEKEDADEIIDAEGNLVTPGLVKGLLILFSEDTAA
jgi:predicted amidohydrolase